MFVGPGRRFILPKMNSVLGSAPRSDIVSATVVEPGRLSSTRKLRGALELAVVLRDRTSILFRAFAADVISEELQADRG
jgi:hypothetical protein